MSTPGPRRARHTRTNSPVIEWAARAACAAHPHPDLWFTEGENAHQQAVAVCSACPVKAECLDYALSVPGLPGIWGGTTATARARLRSSRRHTAA